MSRLISALLQLAIYTQSATSVKGFRANRQRTPRKCSIPLPWTSVLCLYFRKSALRIHDRQRSMHRSLSPAPLTTALVLFISLLSFNACVAAAAPTAGGDAVFRGIEASQSGKYDAAERLLRTATQDPVVKYWALLSLGRLYEKRDNNSEAIRHYEAVPAGVAAHLDAALAALRLRLDPKSDLKPPTKQAINSALPTLEKEAKRLLRDDLQGEFTLLKAQLAKLQGANAEVVSLIASIRTPTASRALSARARVLLRSVEPLRASSERDIPALLKESAQLLIEDEPYEAHEVVRKARALAQKGSNTDLVAALSEEKVLRALGRNGDADSLLKQIASVGGIGSGDEALARLIQRAWNRDDYDEALSQMRQLRSRLPKSPLIVGMEQLEGAVYDAKKLPSEAALIFARVAKNADTPQARAKALRSLGWVEYRQRHYANAAKAFFQGSVQAANAVDLLYKAPGGANPRLSQRELRDILDERYHHLFWLGSSLAKLTEAERAELGIKVSDPKTVFAEIVDLAPRQYYGLLAAKALSRSPASIVPETTPAGACLMANQQHDVSRFAALSDSGLKEFAEAEVTFSLTGSHADLAERARTTEGGNPYSREEVAFILSRARLLQRFGRPQRGIAIADALFSKPSILAPFSFDERSCVRDLFEAAFPTPYLEQYRSASQASGVPVQLLLAISRTESYFDPMARSSKDARGLMQLLVETAREEGLGGSESLFEPTTNIKLGSRHLARLLGIYAGAEQLAVAAYNGGRTAVARWRDRNPGLDLPAWTETISYPETRNYVRRVFVARTVYEQLLGLE